MLDSETYKTENGQDLNLFEVNEEVKSNNLSQLQQNKKKNVFIDFLQSIILALIICIFVYVFIAMPNQISGDSMNPNFYNDEIILTSKLTQWLGGTLLGKSINLDYHRGDVIVFQKPGFADFIKRIIGLSGEKIAIKQGNVYINDSKLTENYIDQDVLTLGKTLVKNGADSITIPNDSYFVMGDNRENSFDSRFTEIGFIKREWMKGKVVFKYWPISKLSIIRL